MSGPAYFYIVNYPVYEKELCLMEMRSLFGEDIPEKHFFSDTRIDPTRSPYMRVRLSLLCCGDTLSELKEYLSAQQSTYDDFKFVRFTFPAGELGYREWISSAAELGSVIHGEVDMVHPKNLLGLTKVGGRWILGEYEKNDILWKSHLHKPNTSSHSLGLETARALVNIAAGTDAACTLVDPCCGVGTVVIEAASMGVSIRGFEIIRSQARRANENLLHFGYEPVVTRGDMHEIEEHFDTAILDIPYGIFSHVSHEQQRALILSTRRIADRMLLITVEDMSESIEAAGFSILDRAQIQKNQFSRYITLCC